VKTTNQQGTLIGGYADPNLILELTVPSIIFITFFLKYIIETPKASQ